MDSGLLLIPVGIRRAARMLTELTQEIFIIVVAALVGDDLHAQRRGEQQIFREGNAAGDHILVEAHSEQLLVGRTEMPVAQVEAAAGVLCVPFLLRIGEDRAAQDAVVLIARMAAHRGNVCDAGIDLLQQVCKDAMDENPRLWVYFTGSME